MTSNTAFLDQEGLEEVANLINTRFKALEDKLATAAPNDSLPDGTIIAYYPTERVDVDNTSRAVVYPGLGSSKWAIPDGWYECNGENGTPDLRGRFIMGATAHVDDSNMVGCVNNTGGALRHTITIENLPSHTHSVAGVSITEATTGGSLFSGGEDEIRVLSSVETSSTGDGYPLETAPPYYVLIYIMKNSALSDNTEE